MEYALKLLAQNTDSARVGGYLVVWGNSAQKDLQGEYFTPQTELGLDWYDRRPALYHHGLDGTMKSTVIGVIDSVKADNVGVWAEAQLDMRKKYVDMVLKLVERGALGWSSGSLPHLVEVAQDGNIKRWPIVEGSLTPTPAEPRRTGITTIKSAFNDLGIDTARLELDTQTHELTADVTTPDLKELAAKAGMDWETDADTSNGAGNNPPTSSDDNNKDKIKMDPREVVTGLLAAILQARPEWQLTPEEQNSLIEQTVAGTGVEATASVDPAFAAAAAPIIGKAVNAHFAAKQAKADAFKAAIVEAAKNAVSATAGANGQSQAASFQATPAQAQPRTPVVTGVRDNRFDHLKATDMALAYQMLTGMGKPVSGDFMKAMAYKTAQDVERGVPSANTLAMKSAFPFLKANDVFSADHPGIKANEVMGVSQSGFGSNYANTYYSSSVWEVVRQETPVYEQMLAMGMDEAEVPQGYKSDTVPLEGADMTWYTAGPAADELASSAEITPLYSSSKFATSNKEVTLARLSARTYWTRELEEDSIVGIVAEANRKIQVSGKEQIEYILINGDTETAGNTNINTIDGTPGTGASRPAYLLLNGLLKLPLVTDTSATYAAGGTLNAATFQNLLPLMDADHVSGKNAIDPDKIFWLVDNSTYFAALGIPEFKTRDVNGMATIESGNITAVWGSKLLRSAQMAKANTAGKVATGTPANNTRGRILCVRPDQWAARWKSQIEVFTEFDPKSYTTTLAAHMRWGINYRANGAAAVAVNVLTTIS